MECRIFLFLLSFCAAAAVLAGCEQRDASTSQTTDTNQVTQLTNEPVPIDLGVTGVPLGFKQVWYSDLREIGSDKGGLLEVNIRLSKPCFPKARRPKDEYY